MLTAEGERASNVVFSLILDPDTGHNRTEKTNPTSINKQKAPVQIPNVGTWHYFLFRGWLCDVGELLQAMEIYRFIPLLSLSPSQK